MFEAICIDNNDDTLYYLTQWDINQKLIMELTGNHLDNINSLIEPMVHFYNRQSSVAIVIQSEVIKNKVVVKIPNELLTVSLPLYADVYLTDYADTSSKKTICSVCIPVRQRKKPEDYNFVQNITDIQYADIVNAINISEQNISNIYDSIKVIDSRMIAASPNEIRYFLMI